MAAALGACATPLGPVVDNPPQTVPRCEDVPLISAPAQFYAGSPIYVGNEMPTDRVRDWASSKPGFEEIWIDREHHGWITVAFSRDAEARQAELRQQFPGVGAVVVAVPWTMAELEALQLEVHRRLPLAQGSGIQPQRGIVTVFLGPLTEDRIAAAQAAFGGRRICIEGIDPALLPQEGPQQPSGDGWRLLVDRVDAGSAYRTGIAFDAPSLAALWAEIRLADPVPEIDFEAEVVVWFGAVYSSSCPRLRLDDVVVNRERALVHARIVALDAVGICTADANPRAYVVALERSKLPVGPFAIQLGAADPPAGVPEERTYVDADLSAPGSIAQPDEIRPGEPLERPPTVEPGGFIEPGYEWHLLMPVDCGLEWLGPLNDTWWRTAEVVGPAVPPAWEPAVDEGTIDLVILISEGQPPTLTAAANGRTVQYVASPAARPACE
jgi:hypothetical protein